MRLLQAPLARRVPGVDAIIETLHHTRPDLAQPAGIAADAPVAINLYNAAQLTVRGGVEGMIDQRADGEVGTEPLVPARILAVEKLGLPQAALELGEEMRQRLGIIPYMGARTMAAAAPFAAPFPIPQPAVHLAQYGGRFQYAQVARRRLPALPAAGWRRRRYRGTRRIARANRGNAAASRLSTASASVKCPAYQGRYVAVPAFAQPHPPSQVACSPLPARRSEHRHVPAQTYGNGARGARRQREGQIQAAARAGRAGGVGRLLARSTARDGLPQHGGGLEPGAVPAEPAAIDGKLGVIDGNGEGSPHPRGAHCCLAATA